MSEFTDTIELVRRAQQGRPEARGDLVRIVEPRLAEYVGRLTLDRDLTTDIVQESIAEMLKIFDSLKDPQRFWCWIYTITLNKLRAHYRRRWRHKETPLSEVQQDWLEAKDQDVLADLVARELKQIVVCAVGELEPRQRAVLVMRCYEQMSYGQISRAMGCTQLGARALFYRAKKSMAKLLNAHGIDKGALPVALLIFGKLSATSEAAISGVSITASALRVGPWGTLAAMAARHAVLTAALGAAAVAGGGAMMVAAGRAEDGPPAAIAMASAPQAGAVSQGSSCWYYYPPGLGEAVMVRTGGRAIAYSQWLGKEQANYYRRGDTIRIRNHRQFAPDLSVWRLPTDKPELRSFLQAQDGWSCDLDYAAPSRRGMLVAVDKAQGGRLRQATLNYDVSVEDYFRHAGGGEALRGARPAVDRAAHDRHDPARRGGREDPLRHEPIARRQASRDRTRRPPGAAGLPGAPDARLDREHRVPSWECDDRRIDIRLFEPSRSTGAPAGGVHVATESPGAGPCVRRLVADAFG